MDPYDHYSQDMYNGWEIGIPLLLHVFLFALKPQFFLSAC